MTTPKPLPCPFCGIPPRVHSNGSEFIVLCRAIRCKVNPETYPVELGKGPVRTRERAIQIWNQRPTPKS